MRWNFYIRLKYLIPTFNVFINLTQDYDDQITIRSQTLFACSAAKVTKSITTTSRQPSIQWWYLFVMWLIKCPLLQVTLFDYCAATVRSGHLFPVTVAHEQLPSGLVLRWSSVFSRDQQDKIMTWAMWWGTCFPNKDITSAYNFQSASRLTELIQHPSCNVVLWWLDLATTRPTIISVTNKKLQKLQNSQQWQPTDADVSTLTVADGRRRFSSWFVLNEPVSSRASPALGGRGSCGFGVVVV